MTRAGSRHLRVRIVASLAAVALSAGALTFTLWQTSSSAGLPSVAPQELLASVVKATASNPTVSGEVATHVDLGLPDLSNLPVQPSGSAGIIGLLESVSGDHTLRVWRSPDGVRVSDLLPAAERSIIATHSDAWAWDSQTYTAYHLIQPPQALAAPGEMPSQINRSASLDPEAIAQRVLSALTPSSSVSLGANTHVAGRDAYSLLVEPNTTQTLVGRIEIDVDAQTHLPTRIAVYARGASDPAISAEFTSVSFDSFDPSVFDFTPPAGAKVTPINPPQRPAMNAISEKTIGQDIRTFGTGWSAVVAVRTPSVEVLQKRFGADLSMFLPYSGPLVSARLVDRGDHAWVIAGPVPQPSLARVEPELT